MIGSVFQHPQAEQFAQLIDEAAGTQPTGTTSTLDDSLADLASVGRGLRKLPVTVQARQEFRDDLRAMLLATAEREGIGVTAVDPEPESRRRAIIRSLRGPAGSRPAIGRRARRHGVVVIGLTAGTIAFAGMSAASDDAVPGDALYSVKRSTEKAQLALAGSDISRGQLHLEFARTRLDEAQAVKDPTGRTSVLNEMDNETLQGVKLLTTTAVARRDAAMLDAIDAFVRSQRTAAEELRTAAGDDARTRATKSVALLEEIERRSKALRPLLKCGGVSAADNLGPVPNGSACKASGGQRTGGPQPSPSQHGLPSPTGVPTTVLPSPSTTVSPSAVTSSATASAPASPTPDDGSGFPAKPRPSLSGRKSLTGFLDWLFQ